MWLCSRLGGREEDRDREGEEAYGESPVCLFYGDPEVEAVLRVGDGCHCRARRMLTAARRRVLAAMASELEAGVRVLVAWPAHVNPDVNDTDLWGRPPDARDQLVASKSAGACGGERAANQR